MLNRNSLPLVFRYCQYVFFIGILISVGGKFLSGTAVAYAATSSVQDAASCPVATTPTAQSLLIVVLDRSGSLTFQPGATDPNLYSTSVTKALVDLWPGNMAVIPFSMGTTPILGPDTLSDPQQQADLKSKVESYPIGGDTPLAPALQGAYNLLQQKGTPGGSRIIIITDGNPTGTGNNDGPHQEALIRSTLIPEFCTSGVPVSTFGLTIDTTTRDGQDANSLLTDIAHGTGAAYTNVTGPEDLAKEVIGLYAQWQGLNFTPLQRDQRGNYTVAIDPLADRVSILSFRSGSNYGVKLFNPNNQDISQSALASTDRHYLIYGLNAIVAGNYTVESGGDPDVQVYALVSSPLKIQLVQPTATTLVRDDQSVTIQADFLNGPGQVTPQVGAAQVIAQVTLFVNGRPAGPPTNTVILTQQKNSQGSLTPIFSGGTLVYNQPGELHIEILGTYQEAQRETSVTFQLVPPPVPPKVVNYLPTIVVGISILAVLILSVLGILFVLNWRRNQPKPYGYITNGKRGGDVALDTFSKPVVSSHDIQTRGVFNFSRDFELVFSKEGTVTIRTRSSGVTVEVPNKLKPETVTSTGVELKPGRKIYTDGYKAASFETSAGKTW